jgi:hypothetical protein
MPFHPTIEYTLDEVYHKIDLFQQVSAYYTFSMPKPAVKLIDVEYDTTLNIDISKFRRELKNLQNKFPLLVNMDNISASNDI